VHGTGWLIVLLFLSAAPLALAFPYLARKRPNFGTSRFLLAAAVGFIAIVPAALVQAAAPRIGQGALDLLFHAFVVIALSEEGAKFLLLRITRKFWGNADNGIPAGIAASLGFAFFETIVYASVNPSALVIRAVTAAPLHAACGSWIGRAALASRPFGFVSVFYVFFAVSVHGAYDMALLVPGFPVLVPAAIALFGLAVSLRQLGSRLNGEI
jgi:RsiW-degrading membrane proteinase PrsW (M82 family)